MNTDELLDVTPEEMAKSLLARRQLLKQQLPTVIRTLEAEEQNLAPKAKKAPVSYTHLTLPTKA